MFSENHKVVECARTWIGTPFHAYANVKNVGVDCINFVIEAHNEAYGTKIVGNRFRELSKLDKPEIDALFIHFGFSPVKLDSLQEGDVLLFSVLGINTHVGVYTGVNIIHTYIAMGGVVEHFYDSRWKRRTVGAYRYGK